MSSSRWRSPSPSPSPRQRSKLGVRSHLGAPRPSSPHALGSLYLLSQGRWTCLPTGLSKVSAPAAACATAVQPSTGARVAASLRCARVCSPLLPLLPCTDPRLRKTGNGAAAHGHAARALHACWACGAAPSCPQSESVRCLCGFRTAGCHAGCGVEPASSNLFCAYQRRAVETGRQRSAACSTYGGPGAGLLPRGSRRGAVGQSVYSLLTPPRRVGQG